MVRSRIGSYKKWPSAETINYQDIWHGPCTAESFRNLIIQFPYWPNQSDLETLPQSWRDKCLHDANEYLDNHVRLFSLGLHDLGKKINWHRDYASGKNTPCSYSGHLDYRDHKKVGDVKIIWELSRMQHLTRLAQAWCYTGDECYASKIVEQISDWIISNPWMMGINWTSPMECALRVITWTWSFHLIRNWDGLNDKFCQLLIISIHQHLKTIDSTYSLYSSANNHLIAEASGVYLASAYWNGLKRAETWKKRAKSHLINECLRQNSSDGVNHEHTFAYTIFVWELLLLPALMGRELGDCFPEEYWIRLESVAEFMSWVSDSKGNTPNIGDQDDGKAINLSCEVNNPIIDMLSISGIAFNRPEFSHWANTEINEKASWIFGKYTIDKPKKVTKRRSRSFSEGGYHVMRTGDGTDQEILLLLDVAPNGDVITGVHGHADALSICLALSGQPFLIDPGTYSYLDTPLRYFFRATSQHNTLSFGNDDQSEYVNRFLWGKREKVELIHVNLTNECCLVTGKVKWWTGSSHERQVETDFENSRIILRDKWQSNKKTRLNFTVAPQIQVEHTSSRACKLIGEKVDLNMEFDQGAIDVKDMLFSSRCYQKELTSRIIINLHTTSGEVETRCSWYWKH
jgi:hypothetical protein